MPKKKYVDEFWLINVKNLKEFKATINGRPFALTGGNGAGKTTGFQALLRAVASLPKTEKPEVWITTGEDAAEIGAVLVDNGDTYLVSEKITKSPGSRSRLRLWKVTGENGEYKDEITPAQERLQQIFGTVLDLTPLIDMTGQEQFKYLKTQLSIDTTAYETKRKQLTQARAQSKGKRTFLEALVKEQNISEKDVETYADEKKVDEILKKKTPLEPLQADFDRLIDQVKVYAELEALVKDCDEQIAQLQKKRADALKHLKNKSKVNADLEEAQKKLVAAAELNEKVDEEVKTLSDHNVKHNKVVVYLQKKKEVEAEKEKWKQTDEDIKKLDKSFSDDVLSLLPFDLAYPGLKLEYKPKDDEQEEQVGLFLNDLPFKRTQQSYGEMVKALIKLSVYLNPEGLNFVYIQDWNLLDGNNQDDLLEFAEQQGVQLGIEKVENHAEIGIEFIEVKEKKEKKK